ncbi:hypothetical protein Hanom_Chr03g00187811 [Helianthus anomalus]
MSSNPPLTPPDGIDVSHDHTPDQTTNGCDLNQPSPSLGSPAALHWDELQLVSLAAALPS